LNHEVHEGHEEKKNLNPEVHKVHKEKRMVNHQETDGPDRAESGHSRFALSPGTQDLVPKARRTISKKEIKTN
jgi:hypothetical protein